MQISKKWVTKIIKQRGVVNNSRPKPTLKPAKKD
jgi:hypothetical protein